MYFLIFNFKQQIHWLKLIRNCIFELHLNTMMIKKPKYIFSHILDNYNKYINARNFRTIFNNNMWVLRAYITTTQRTKLNVRASTHMNEIYKIYRESRHTAGHVKRDLLFLVRKHVDGKRYQNIYFCDR